DFGDLTTALLRNDLTIQLGNALPTPTQIQTVSCNGGPQTDSLQHCLRWGSSNGSMVSLCYIATREMVWYRTFKFTNRGSISIPAYGNENGWKHRMFAPWWPVLQFAPDNPSTTNWHPNGLMGNATDNHTLPPQGPHVDMQIGNLSDRLEETEVHAEQIYQYNATGDPATWERDRQGSGVVSVTHPNDRHWTDFPGGKWKIVRRIYKGPNRTWMYELKKIGGEGCNSGEMYTRTCPVKGPTGAPMTY
ncbi:MAG: hypothetical protein HC889_02255, partial [Synechococcaceae cyanobacterium SM1_2_3]|nr:hypothetical protein [Synechococcaceae cyanobacterium SM1_2_3]